MEAETYPTLLRLRLPPAGANSDGSHASCKLARVQELSCSPGRLTTGDSSHVSGGVTVRAVAGMVAVLAAVLAVVHGSAPVEGHSRTSPAASDGCPLGKMLGTVAEATDVPVAVQVTVQVVVQVAVLVAGQVAVFAAVHVGGVVDRRGDTSPSVGATVPCPDLLFCFCPYPTFDGAAGVLPLSPFDLAEPLVAGRCVFSLRDVGTFFTLACGGMSLPTLRGTLAALMGGALDDPAVAGTTVPGDLLAEVLGWDLESLALGEGRGGGCEGKRSRFARKGFLDTLGREDGGGLGVEEEVVVVGGVRLLNLGEDAWVRRVL
ncbi:hypothetical protein NDU88_003397 [Pleurodeles waltl]|uniref:Uncharacterized protein n=1 Tax=Pleurodeles waltl TaxID=8319 RepID=A0AAV7VD76_PLEWA|nr:hypothetical protein NDU88_003397 [Pleurodeles waltl]